MRVIAGQAKGKRLAPVPGTTTRPITDRVKTALFGILEPNLGNARFLDLFAGTGAVGIEALSRGADQSWFVERQGQAIRVIHANLATTGLGESARVVHEDAFRFVRRSTEQFDIVHIAPPQYQDLWLRALIGVGDSTVLLPGGIAIVQIFPKEYRHVALRRLELFDQRTYGSTMLCFFRFKETAE